MRKSNRKKVSLIRLGSRFFFVTWNVENFSRSGCIHPFILAETLNPEKSPETLSLASLN